jgi:hypothetical protein
MKVQNAPGNFAAHRTEAMASFDWQDWTVAFQASVDSSAGKAHG